ncbi:MAG: ABC transporter substrate-binding protein [Chloroflexi bacterium]|nr:ABC transporter substrate-binding protein [Chloroflexota bacterium]
MTDNYWTRRRFGRRAVLRTSGLGVAGLGAAALVGCGDDDDKSSATAAPGGGTTTSGTTPSATKVTTAAKPAGQINVAVSTLMEQSTSPFFQTGGGSFVLYSQAFEGFYNTGMDGKSEPRLAESMEMIDGQNIRFKLRKGVKFSDGSPLTIEDIKWSYDSYVNNDPLAGQAARLKKGVAKIDYPDESTVVVSFTQPVPFAMEEFGVLGASRGWPIASKAYFDKVGADTFKSSPVATAPWHITKNVVGQYVEMEANENYWNPAGVPRVKTVRINLVPEQTTRIAQIKTGEADIIEGIIGPAADTLKNESNIKIVDTKNTAQLTVRFQDLWDANTKSVQADPRFREALILAVNQDQVAKSLLKLGSPSPQVLIFPNSSGYDANIFKAPKQDVARAKALMKEAGAEGQSMRLGAYTSSSYPLIPEIMQAYSGFWKDIGLNTQIAVQESGSYFTDFQKHTPRGLGAISFPNFSSGAILLVTYFKAGAPYSTMDNIPEIQAVISELEKEFDSKKQDELVTKGMKIAYDKFLYIPAPYVDSLWAVGKKVKDWTRIAGIPYTNSFNTLTLA